VHIYNPQNGWLQNCNSTPFTAAGENSPKKENYLPYIAPDGENFRGINAVRVLSKEKAFTIDKLIAAGYDRTLTAFEVLIPALIKAYEKVEKESNNYSALAGPIEVLRNWNYKSSDTSVATTLAVEWAQKLGPSIQRVYIDQGEADQVEKTKQFASIANPQQLLDPLTTTINELKTKWNKWEISLG
jgi:acyl-homoserine-lactone acylase